MQKKNKLITHNGSFHTDEIFSTAMFSLLFEKRKEDFEIIRTRDEELINQGDYVFDVGGIYDEKKNRFDHHQVGGAGERENGIKYSSFGLVWKKFGVELTGSEKVATLIDERLVAPIDASDNGIDLVESKGKTFPYFIYNIFSAMLPTWREDTLDKDKMFFKGVEIARVVLEREIKQATDLVDAEDAVIALYENTEDKRIIVLDQNYPFEYILNKFKEPLFAIYPRKTDNSWGVKAIRDDLKSFANRKDFPKEWAGLRDLELEKVTRVSDALFCHHALYLAVAKSKEGAIKLAQLALNS